MKKHFFKSKLIFILGITSILLLSTNFAKAVNPAPVILNIFPNFVQASPDGFPLTINGNGFTAESRVWFTNSDISTPILTEIIPTFFSPTMINVNIPGGLTIERGTAFVYVGNNNNFSNNLPIIVTPALASTPPLITTPNNPTQTPTQTTQILTPPVQTSLLPTTTSNLVPVPPSFTAKRIISVSSISPQTITKNTNQGIVTISVVSGSGNFQSGDTLYVALQGSTNFEKQETRFVSLQGLSFDIDTSKSNPGTYYIKVAGQDQSVSLPLTLTILPQQSTQITNTAPKQTTQNPQTPQTQQTANPQITSNPPQQAPTSTATERIISPYPSTSSAISTGTLNIVNNSGGKFYFTIINKNTSDSSSIKVESSGRAGSSIVQILPPGKYSITQSLTNGLQFSSASCNTGNTTDTTNGVDNVTVSGGSTTICAFYNKTTSSASKSTSTSGSSSDTGTSNPGTQAGLPSSKTGNIEIERVNPNLQTLTGRAAVPITNAWVDSLPPQKTNPAVFTSIDPKGEHTISVTDAIGYTETVGSCLYPIGETGCTVSNFYPLRAGSCNGTSCTFPVDIVSGKVFKFVFKYTEVVAPPCDVDDNGFSSCGEIQVLKYAEGNEGTFDFTSNVPYYSKFRIETVNNGVNSNSMMNKNLINIPPGSYKIDEVSTAGWKLREAVCDGEVVTDSNGKTVAGSIKVTAGETTVCVFRNIPDSSSVSANSASGVLPSITYGQSGDAVSNLQQTLMQLGYPIASGTTGYFGNQTVLALASFQTDNGLSQDSPALGKSAGPWTRAMFLKHGFDLNSVAQSSSGSGSNNSQTATNRPSNTIICGGYPWEDRGLDKAIWERYKLCRMACEDVRRSVGITKWVSASAADCRTLYGY
ncbi:MAG: peptidoglycan-binding protein [Candidatus Staskawiczbacteria bacterium]|nr:peptidoglycan-binding protein [Candidatus Staskawiczbacteria bacterium]